MTSKIVRFDELEKRRLFAIVIQGIQPAALDQPRINAYIRIPGQPLPMSTESFFGDRSFDLEPYFDTGASGVLLDNETAAGYSSPGYETVPAAYAGPNPVIFADVGVGGTEDFGVSQPLDIGLAPFHQANADLDLDNPETYQQVYNQTFSPIKTQLGPLDAEPNPLGPLNVFGTPLMQNKVVVFDPRPVNTFLDTMRTYVYSPDTLYHPLTEDTDPGIVPTSRHIKLSYGSFDRFTKVTPSTAAGPTLATNPFIGSNPVRALDGLPADDSPPVSMSMGSFNTTGSFLLDTGAASSILSTHKALSLGVRYRAGTAGTTAPILETTSGATLPDQFQLTIGGIGGTVKMAGFFMDDMTIQTEEGESITFQGAPVLVGDITVLDDHGTPATGDDQAVTLDGIFGMNYLVASAFISEGTGNGDIQFDALTENAFDWVTYDTVNGRLGLELGNPLPNPRVVDQLFDVDGQEQAFYVQFNRDVSASLTASDVSIKNLTTNFTLPTSYLTQAWEPLLNTATFLFPHYDTPGYLPDGNYRATIAAGNVDDGSLPLAADYVNDFFFLNGDATRDRKVDTKDFNVLAKNFGKNSEAIFTEGDFNYDQTINSLDFSKFISQYGSSLPAPVASAVVGNSSGTAVALTKHTNVQSDLRPRMFLSPGLVFGSVQTTAASSVLGSTLPVPTTIFSSSKIDRDTMQELLA